MKKKNILLAAVAWIGCLMGAGAQEYLHVTNHLGEQCYPLEEIDCITLESVASLAEAMEKDDNISIFTSALKATGLDKRLAMEIDYSYDAKQYPDFYYAADIWREMATVPPYKMRAFTLFVETDDVLKSKYGVNNLDELKALAKRIYDQTYPADAGLYDDDVTHPQNPLYRFVAYHVLTRDVQGLDRLTGRILNQGIVNGPIGVKTNLMNPIEWYQTLLPNTMMKCEMLTVEQWIGETCTQGNYYLNRRWDENYQIRGAEVSETGQENAVPNGRYFYADDLVAFTTDVRDKVQNMLIRMDFSTVFPELMTLDIRQNGDPTKDDNSAAPDKTFQNGRNYWFPNGSLDGLKVNEGVAVYRRPHWNFWNYQGDEFKVFGDYDVEISLPPVPFSGEWQVRLGFCALPTRGIAEIYFDDVMVNDSVDFRLYLDDNTVLGWEHFSKTNYHTMSKEEKAAEQKKLKEMGFYRGPYGGYHTDGNVVNEFITNSRTYRRVLCQTYLDSSVEHTLRIRCISRYLTGNNNELMLDYIELVPKSVYDIPEGEMESDL